MRRALFALFLSLVLAACAPPTPRLPERSADDLLAAVRARAGQVRSVKGVAQLRVTLPERQISGRQVLLVQRPDQLRADALSPFGQPLALLAVHDGRLAAYVPGEATAYTGAATADNIGRFTRLPLAAETLVALALYDPPLLEGAAAVRQEDGCWWLSLHDGRGLVQELALAADGQLTAVRWLRDGALLLAVRYGDFAAIDGVVLPAVLDIDLPASGLQARLSWRGPKINTPIDPVLFRISWPAGSRVVDLDSLPAS